MPINNFLIIAAFLFSIGLAIVLTKRNAIMVLMGIELMLNAVNINLVAFSQIEPTHQLEGQLFSLFVMVVAAAEVSIALAIIIKLYDFFKTIDLSKINKLKN